MSTNPFIQAYFQSDILGKLIFLGLIFLSFVTWTVLLYKFFLLRQLRQQIPLILKERNYSVSRHDMVRFIKKEVRGVREYLFLLSTIVSLAPFLGLLGTVWGILITFAHMPGTRDSDAILGGLSLALTTTVLGLINAIPALIGHNYFKDASKKMEEEFLEFYLERETLIVDPVIPEP